MTKKSDTAVTLSCGIIPVKKIDGRWHFLLLRCFRYWDFPKGHVERDEDPFMAATREMVEETGITKFKSSWGNKFRETEMYAKSKIARYYLAEIISDEEVKLEPNPESGIVEHHEFRWLEYDEARALLVPRVQKIIDWAQQQID